MITVKPSKIRRISIYQNEIIPVLEISIEKNLNLIVNLNNKSNSVKIY
jgi:hypothetical protein